MPAEQTPIEQDTDAEVDTDDVALEEKAKDAESQAVGGQAKTFIRRSYRGRQ